MMPRLKCAIDALMDFLSEHTPLEQLPNADIIFVFGHIDERVAQQAAYLWHMGKAPRIVIAGKGVRVPQGYETEADYYASLIIARGTPADVILLEKESTNSLENVQRGSEVWKRAGFDPKIIIACSIPPLLRRSCATLRKQCSEAIVHGSAFKLPIEEWTSWERLMRMVKEIDRMEEYAEKGDIEAVEIPPHVRSAAKTVKLYCIA